MRKFKKLSFVLVLAMVLTMTFGVSAFAESSYPELFDLGKQLIRLAPGDTYHDQIWVNSDNSKTFSIYITGSSSKNTRVWSDFKTGWSYYDVTIGEDETAGTVNLFFYIDETQEYDCVNIRIVDSAHSDGQPAQNKATKTQTAASTTTAAKSDDALALFYAFNAEHPEFLPAFLAAHPEFSLEQ